MATWHIHGKPFLLYTLISFQFEVWTFSLFSFFIVSIIITCYCCALDSIESMASARETEFQRNSESTEQSAVQFTIDRVIEMECRRSSPRHNYYNAPTLMKAPTPDVCVRARAQVNAAREYNLQTECRRRLSPSNECM